MHGLEKQHLLVATLDMPRVRREVAKITVFLEYK